MGDNFVAENDWHQFNGRVVAIKEDKGGLTYTVKDQDDIAFDLDGANLELIEDESLVDEDAD